MEVAAKMRKTLQGEVENARAEGAMQLLSDIEKTLNEKESSDVAFICKEGEYVHGSRWLLSLRCPVFKAMFRHEMAESKSSEVPLPQFSSSVMRCIFEYLYTGAVKSYTPQTWKMGFELISAAHYFMISAVEVFAQNFLWNKSSEACKEADLNLVTEMLNEALEFHENWEGRDAMLVELTDDLRKSWCHGKNDFLKLSENAMDFVLSKLKGNGNGKSPRQGLYEYNSFRQIVLWHVHQNVPPSDVDSETRKKMQQVVPSPQDEPSLWRGIFESQVNISEYACQSFKAQDPTAVLKSRIGIDIQKKSFKRLLDHIDWRRIPTMLLLKVIWPLKVIRSQIIFESLAIQALEAPLNTWACTAFDWKHSKNLTCDCATVICHGTNGLVDVLDRAVASLPMARPHGTYEWQFEIQESDATLINVGFICGSDVHLNWDAIDFQAPYLDESFKRRVVAIDCDSGATHISTEPNPKNCYWEYWRHVPVGKSSVKFTLDVSQKTCQVSLGNFTTAFHRLPGSVYFPIVEVKKGRFVKIELKLSEGFHCNLRNQKFD